MTFRVAHFKPASRVCSELVDRFIVTVGEALLRRMDRDYDGPVGEARMECDGPDAAGTVSGQPDDLLITAPVDEPRFGWAHCPFRCGLSTPHADALLRHLFEEHPGSVRLQT